ncbi:MAG: hypothetical protein HY376_03160 [Candidatus Blackburnbacteria bacterium]|nr:hypothetical protein [Candidatus Blackburnbacteria bacterium]
MPMVRKGKDGKWYICHRATTVHPRGYLGKDNYHKVSRTYKPTEVKGAGRLRLKLNDVLLPRAEFEGKVIRFVVEIVPQMVDEKLSELEEKKEEAGLGA